jgi:metal-sulfur cluster biosynthetic enzyme
VAIDAAVRDALQRVSDPEYAISIVDLGLVYGVRVDGDVAHVTLTFTSIGCPAIDMIVDDVRQAARGVAGIRDVAIEIVWSPPWSRERISPRGKQVLQMYGVAT